MRGEQATALEVRSQSHACFSERSSRGKRPAATRSFNAASNKRSSAAGTFCRRSCRERLGCAAWARSNSSAISACASRSTVCGCFDWSVPAGTPLSSVSTSPQGNKVAFARLLFNDDLAFQHHELSYRECSRASLNHSRLNYAKANVDRQLRRTPKRTLSASNEI